MSVLIADSGSTKTDWSFLEKGAAPIHFTTKGINPYLESGDSILKMLGDELPTSIIEKAPDAISYYGAGASSKEKQALLKKLLQKHFKITDVEVQGDLLAAARALCGDDSGVVCILGTGSSACFYDGKKVKENHPSLGYLVGDEGSGNHMGKRILQYYTYSTFDEQLKMDFEMRFGNDIRAIVNKLYHEPYPNRLLASFVELLAENRGHYMVENIIEDSFNDFFQRSILKFRQSWKYPINFTGSIAFIFQDVLQSLCSQFELEVGRIEKSPISQLIEYHMAKL